MYNWVMQAKIHLLIISAIILVIFLIWLVMFGNQDKQEPIVVSGYAVEIVRASYGLECAQYSRSLNNNAGPYQSDAKPLFFENNVLENMKERCNGKSQCYINVLSNDVLGLKGAEQCSGKILNVEYRCFKVDRLRKAQTYEGNEFFIDCGSL